MTPNRPTTALQPTGLHPAGLEPDGLDSTALAPAQHRPVVTARAWPVRAGLAALLRRRTPEPEPRLAPAVVLAQAAEVIRRRGHGQGQWHNPDGTLCIEGALVTAAYELGLRRPAALADAVAAPLALIEATLGTNVQYWNDAPDRQPRDVIGVLETTASTTAQQAPALGPGGGTQ